MLPSPKWVIHRPVWREEGSYALSMPSEQGRLERRIRRAVPVLIVGTEGGAESTTTENVCSQGVRVLVRRPLKPGERLLLVSPAGDQRVQGRVIYCERLHDGHFAAGLEFYGKPVGSPKWLWVPDAIGPADSN
jgi:hypothetical protein